MFMILKNLKKIQEEPKFQFISQAKNATEKFYKIEKHNYEVKKNLVNFKVGKLKEDYQII